MVMESAMQTHIEASEQTYIGMREEIDELKKEVQSLRKAARLIHQRPNLPSGSLEMAECDDFLKTLNLDVWKWPCGDFWKI